jgi:hypothetical protein
MKKIIPVFLLVIVAFSCRKEKKVNPADVRLLRAEREQAGVWYKTNFEYDGSGRIVKVTVQENNQPATTMLTISYNGSEVTLTEPVIGPAVVSEIKLTLDAEKRVIKRTKYSFLEFTPPIANPQRTYIYDTLLYEYDATGLLKKVTGSNYDSTWYDPGSPLTSVMRSASIANYTTVNNNLTTINKVTTTNSTVRNAAGNTVSSSGSMEDNKTLQYNRGYSNSTDFTNTAILNEVELFSLSPLNKNYKSLPEKASSTHTTKDQAGNVISNTNAVVDATLTYNSYGFLSSVSTTPGTPPVQLIYNQ